MIIVDFNQLIIRTLFMSISQSKPKKLNDKYITDEYINFFYHLTLNSLRSLHLNFTKKYGQIVIAIDSSNNWRKSIYPEYKIQRKSGRKKSEVNFDEFFEKVNYLVDNLKEFLPYKFIKIDEAEADDIIAVLTKKYYRIEKILIVSSDKDFKQLLKYDNVDIYDPINLKFIKMNKKELKEWEIEHILLGDKSDNVPNIKVGTKFSDNFLKYLKENNIFIEDVEEFNKLSISKILYENYSIFKKNKKGEDLDELDIFKQIPFGPVGAKKFAKDLEANLNENKILKENFERNKKLVLFDNIPSYISYKILNEFDNIQSNLDIVKLNSFLLKHNLIKLFANVSDFYIEIPKSEKKIGDWF